MVNWQPKNANIASYNIVKYFLPTLILVKYDKIIANIKQHTSLVICHLISTHASGIIRFIPVSPHGKFAPTEFAPMNLSYTFYFDFVSHPSMD